MRRPNPTSLSHRKNERILEGMNLATLGYEGLNLTQFFAILHAQRIETLVDVRQQPLSRKAGFSKSALRAAAEQHQMAYVHLVALGCPRPIRTAYRQDNDWHHYTEQYCAYLETQHAVLAEVAQQVQQERCCLICFEADYRSCHRMFVADALRARIPALQVQHLTIRDGAPLHLPHSNCASNSRARPAR